MKQNQVIYQRIRMTKFLQNVKSSAVKVTVKNEKYFDLKKPSKM